MHPSCTLVNQGPQSTVGGMQKAFLEYKVGQAGSEETSFSSALLLLAVTALNIPKEDQGLLHSGLLLGASANCCYMENRQTDMYMHGNETEHAAA